MECVFDVVAHQRLTLFGALGMHLLDQVAGVFTFLSLPLLLLLTLKSTLLVQLLFGLARRSVLLDRGGGLTRSSRCLWLKQRFVEALFACTAISIINFAVDLLEQRLLLLAKASFNAQQLVELILLAWCYYNQYVPPCAFSISREWQTSTLISLKGVKIIARD